MEFVPSIGLAEQATIFQAKLTAAQIFKQPEDSLPVIKNHPP
jgi:hypothetical protein